MRIAPKWMLAIAPIAASLVLSSAAIAQPCSLYKFNLEQAEQPSSPWFQTPLAALLTIPGVALALLLNRGGRSLEE